MKMNGLYYIYQMAKFGVVQKIYSKMHPILFTNTHHDVTDLLNHGMLKNIIFLQNKSYCFVAETTFRCLICQHALHAYVLMCQCGLRADMPT